MGHNALNWTHGYTGLIIIETDAFRTAIDIDFIDFVAFINGIIRTLRQTHVAVDAFIGDQECHA